jgi:Na+/melibiose symporter-like transporter
VKSATSWCVAVLASLFLLIGTIGIKPLVAMLESSRGLTLALFILIIAVWLSWMMHKAVEIGHWKRVRSIRQLAISLTVSLPIFLAIDAVDFEKIHSSRFDLLHTYFTYYALALLLPYSIICLKL